MKTTKLKILIVPCLLAALAGFTPLFAQNAERKVGADANGSTSAQGGGSSSSSSSSSFSETRSKKVVIINGKTVVDESTHTVNGDEVNQGEDDPEGDKRPWLGLRAEAASSALRAQLGLDEEEGIVVVDVVQDGPADQADLRVNDILLKLEGKPLGSPEDLENALEERFVGQTVTVEYLRRGVRGEVDVTLEKNPARDGDGNDPGNQEQMEELLERMRKMMKQEGAGGGARIQIEDVDGRGGNFRQNDGNGSFKIEVNGNNAQDLDAILDNPNLPEEFKRTVRDMQKRMEQFGTRKGED